MKKGKFIIIDGVDGAGKGTQIELLESYLGKDNVYLTREPGGSLIAENIRTVFKHSEGEKFLPETELLLLLAARKQHIETTVKHWLNLGVNVISDRYESSSYAYQLFGREMDEESFERIWNSIDFDIKPDIMFILDLPVEVSMERIKNRDEVADRLDQESEGFFRRVREGFKAFSKRYSNEYPIIEIDAHNPPESVFERIVQQLKIRELNVSRQSTTTKNETGNSNKV